MSLRKHILQVASMLVLSMSLTFTSSAAVLAIPKRSVPVGVVLPLSEGQADLGKSVFNGVELGLFQTLTHDITLYPYDTQSNIDECVTVVEEAIGEHMPFIIGPISSAETSTIQAVTGGRNTFILSLSNDHTVMTPQIYLMGATAPMQIKRLMEFAGSKNIHKVIGIFSDTPQGHQWAEAFQEYGQSYFYHPEEKSDHAAKIIAQHINTLDPDGIFIPEAGNATLTLIANLRFHDENPAKRRFLGSIAWDQPAMLKDQNLNKSWFVTYDWFTWNKFKELYKSHYGAEPSKLSFLGYQAVHKIRQHIAGKHIWDQPTKLSVMEVHGGQLKHISSY